MRASQALTSTPLYQRLPTTDAESRPSARWQLAATSAGLFTALVGAVVLLGWWAGLPLLTYLRAGWPPMVANTALMNVLSGAALVALSHSGGRWRKRFGVAAALLVTLIAAVTLSEWVFDWTDHIDQLLMHADTARRSFPGRPSPPTSLAFLLIGPALAWLDREPVRGLRPSELLCLVAMAAPILALLGYSYGVPHLYGLPLLHPYIGMAFHTAGTLLVLGAGIFVARPASGLMGMLTSPHAVGVAARRTLLAILALPLASWLIILGVRARLYPEDVGTALVVFAALLDGLVLLLATSGHIERKDAALRRALVETAHWQHFFERASWGAAIADADGILRFVNDAFASMHGYAADELIGRPALDMYSAASRPDVAATLPYIHEHGEMRFESEHVRKDGSCFPALVDVTAVKDPNGRLLYRAAYVRDITEVRKAEQDRARLASLVESSDDAVIAATLDGTVVHWNLAAERMYGYSASEMIGRSIAVTVPPARIAELEESLATIARGERFRALETTRLRKDGSAFSAALTISPIIDASGRITGASAIVRDISERKAAEAALARAHELERKLSAGLEQLTRSAVAVSNAVADLPKTNLTAVLNTIALQAQLLTAADYVALGVGTDPEKPFDTWVSVGMTEAQAQAIGRHPRPVGVLGAVAREGEVVRIGDVHEHRAFRGFPAQHPEMTAFLAVPIPFRNRSVGNLYLARRPGGAEFSAQDEHLVGLLTTRAGAAIETARMYVGEALQRAWLQTMVDQMPEPVIVLDEAGNVTLQNRPAQALVRETGRLDPFGKPLLHDIRYPSGEAVPADALPHYRALRSGESVLGAEFMIATLERSLPVVASATPVRVDSHVAGAVAIFQDVSMLKEIERQREEWTSIVAHDLRQPISAISLATEAIALREPAGLPARVRETLQRIQKSADKLRRMTDDLLDASRVEAQRLTVERAPVNLRALIEEVTSTGPEVDGNPVHTSFPQATPWVSADSGRIEQILRNLLSNAAKYGTRGTPIEVIVEPRREAYEISVRNQGAGIASEDMPHLFQRFGRFEVSKRAGISGIGLGLYITKGLVQAHGGRIWAESTPGESTTFHFTLPALVEHAQAGAGAG